MRSFLIFWTAIFLVAVTVFADVEINEVNFPDENFRNWILARNYGRDGILTDAEIAGITSIDIHLGYWNTRVAFFFPISDLTGIEYFIALTYLDCSENQLTSLDVSKNIALTNLNCGSNPLTSLDVSGATALTYLDCELNQLTSLDVSKNTALTKLNCGSNQLTSLDVSKNIALTSLVCYRGGFGFPFENGITSLDVSKNTALTSLNCGNHQLTSLDVSKNTELTYLNCSENNITSLDVSNNAELTTLDCSENQLTSLDVSKNTALTDLNCGINQLTSLDVSKNIALKTLDCGTSVFSYRYGSDYHNQLTSLDVSKNIALTELNCGINQLTSLDVSKNIALTELNCGGNQLTSLDVSKNTALIELECGVNPLFSIDVTKNTALTKLWCFNNELASLDVSKNTALTDLDCAFNHLTALDLTNNTIIPRLRGILQEKFLTFSGVAGNYSVVIDLNNPVFDRDDITYSNGILTSNNREISSTEFAVETGKDYRELSGTLRFIYPQIQGTGTVLMDDWIYGETPSEPIVSGYYEGDVLYEYKLKGAIDDTYSTEKPTNAGEYTIKATFAEGENYFGNISTDDFIIYKAQSTGTVLMDDWIYGETPSEPIISGYYEGNVLYEYKLKGATDDTYSTEKPTNAGEYTIKANFVEGENYFGNTDTDDFIINKAQGTGTVSINDWTYGETPSEPIINGDYDGDVLYEYKLKTATDDTYTTKKPVNVGEYMIKATFAEGKNYLGNIATDDFIIHKAPKTQGTATVSINDWTYGDKPNAPIVVSEDYSLNEVIFTYEGINGTVYSESSNLPVNAGNYLLTATFPENENFVKFTATATFKIFKAKPDYSIPEFTAYVGDTLGMLKLPENWSWIENDSTKVGNAGLQKHLGKFTPGDTVNYLIATDNIPIMVIALKLDLYAEENPVLNKNYLKLFAKTTDDTKITLKVFDVVGNLLFDTSFVSKKDVWTNAIWDLQNKKDRVVAKGSYLLIAEAQNSRGAKAQTRIIVGKD